MFRLCQRAGLCCAQSKTAPLSEAACYGIKICVDVTDYALGFLVGRL
mgnify:CR=1 FL=1